MKSAILLAALLTAACAPLKPILPPVVAYKSGLTVTIRNPFDCNETTELVCRAPANLEYECHCQPARGTRSDGVQSLVDSLLAEAP